MEEKTIAVAAENAGNIQNAGVVEGLLHTGPHGMFVVFGLNDGNGDIGLVVKNVVGPFAFSPGGHFTANVDFSVGKRNLFQKLSQFVPTRFFERGRDELGADVSFR